MAGLVRKAVASDLAPLVRLAAECFAPPWSEAALARAISGPLARAWVAEGPLAAGGGLVAFAMARRVVDLIEIDLVGVAPEARRAGFGGQILAALLASAESEGLALAQLELSSTNAPALALYGGQGFMVVGRRPRYYPDGSDALLMTRPLGPTGPRARDSQAGDRLTGAIQESGGDSGPPVRRWARVLAQEPEGNGRRLQLAVADWPGSQPGQFLMLGAGAEGSVARRDPLLPRPMAIYRELGRIAASGPSQRERSIEVLFRVVGRGTALLSDLRAGDRVSLVGPLGRGFDAAETRSPMRRERTAALLVGGGTGIASLYEWARRLVALGRDTTVLLGARSRGDLLGWDDFARIGVELIGTTEDGSSGTPGLVTGPLAERLRARPQTTVYAVGPTPMMRACAELAAAHGAGCFVSLENPMACGFGVCLGCAAPRRAGGFALVCRAGPVFDASEIDWAGLP